MAEHRRALLLISSVLLMVLAAVSLRAQQPPPTAIPGFLASLDSTTAQLRRGETTFYRDCSLCHLPRIRKEGTTPGPGPNLSGLLKTADKAFEGRVREFIMNGSDRMPAWKYSLKPAEIDDVIAYVKTL